MCPWGAAADDKDYYRPVAAFLRNHDMRCFGGETFELDFDVYNDSDQPHEMSLALSGLDVPAHSLSLEAGGHELVKLEVPTKISEQSVAIQFDSVLSADGAEMHRVTHVLHVEPRREFQAPKGIELISYDPSGKWPHSTSSLNALAWADVAKTLLLLAPGSLGKAESNDAASKPQSGTFDASALKQFLARGGKCLVLEQNTLEPLGLDLELVKHASTMTFPVTIAHPLLKGIDASELSFWRGDNFVTHDEIVRPKFGGARGITVSGGPETLNQSPIVELSVGQGRMVLMQALVGEKRSTEPAAATLLQNAADYLSSLPPTAASTLVLTHDKDFLDKLKSLRLDFTAPKGPLTTTQLHGATLLIIHGGGPMIADSADAIVQFHHDGGTIYWHQPSAEALATIGQRIGAEGLAVKPQPAAATISRRDEPMLLGVTREDLTFHTAPSGWTRSLALQTTASEEFLPHDEPDHSSDLPIAQFSDLKGASLSNGALVFGSRGDAALDVDVSQPGTFQLALSISSTGAPKERPLLGVFINDAFGGLIRLEQDDKSAYLVTLHAPASHFKLKLSWLNGAEYGDGSEVRVHSVEIGSPMHLPENVTPLVDSCALVSIGARSPVILDGIEWDKTGSNEIRGSRYASAMLFNLGATFKSGAD
jgi:hypothetical protein